MLQTKKKIVAGLISLAVLMGGIGGTMAGDLDVEGTKTLSDGSSTQTIDGTYDPTAGEVTKTINEQIEAGEVNIDSIMKLIGCGITQNCKKTNNYLIVWNKSPKVTYSFRSTPISKVVTYQIFTLSNFTQIGVFDVTIYGDGNHVSSYIPRINVSEKQGLPSIDFYTYSYGSYPYTRYDYIVTPDTETSSSIPDAFKIKTINGTLRLVDKKEDLTYKDRNFWNNNYYYNGSYTTLIDGNNKHLLVLDTKINGIYKIYPNDNIILDNKIEGKWNNWNKYINISSSNVDVMIYPYYTYNKYNTDYSSYSYYRTSVYSTDDYYVVGATYTRNYRRVKDTYFYVYSKETHEKIGEIHIHERKGYIDRMWHKTITTSGIIPQEVQELSLF